MKVKAVCPVCGERVPRAWFVRRRLRACRRCSARIETVRKKDFWYSCGIGVVGPAVCGVVGAVVGGAVGGVDGAGLGLVVGWIVVGTPVTLVGSFWLFPWFVPFEGEGLLCAVCGYDLRASLGRCPECGTVRRGS